MDTHITERKTSVPKKKAWVHATMDGKRWNAKEQIQDALSKAGLFADLNTVDPRFAVFFPRKSKLFSETLCQEKTYTQKKFCFVVDQVSLTSKKSY